MKWMLAVWLLAASPAVAREQAPPTPLFASDAPVRITVSGPIGTIARGAEKSIAPHDATLVLADSLERHAIRLSARGLSRRKSELCKFPPLRVEFTQRPAATSLFAGQRRLKLVTHCRPQEGFQQHLLLEYAAYRAFNALSPTSFRARLASIDYVEADGRPITTRWGFFIEDVDDAARRNQLTEARVGDRVLPAQLDAWQGGRLALFQYMIGNLDWSMRAGPAGAGCCHNVRLATGPGGGLIPMPYDFDYSGLVDAPYAVPPRQFRTRSVRKRVYRGYCSHNDEALAAAADLRGKRPAIEAMLGLVPGLEERTRRKAISYLAGFFADIATDELVRERLLKECVG